MTSCWGVKNFVTSQSGVTGNAAEGVPHFEMSTTLSAPVSSAGTSARYMPASYDQYKIFTE